MLASELREQFQHRLADFLWDQWAQLGVSAPPTRDDDWAIDPEALLLLTFEVGREEPRLFAEVLDWLVVNERAISVQRLRNLTRDEGDRALVEAVLGWLGAQRRRARLEARPRLETGKGPPEPFFRSSELGVGEPDPAFFSQGFLKPPIKPSGNSQTPALQAPINLAFRLRALLGIGARAEVVRVLLTAQAPWVNVAVIAASTAYTKRNVQEALSSLVAAGALGSSELGNEGRFNAPRQRWAHFLEVDQLPRHEDWPQLFNAYRLLLRWLADPAHTGLSDYMLASQARDVLERAAENLRFAGIPVSLAGPDGADYWQHFTEIVQGLPAPRAPRSRP
jgi:hypothetical protein